MNLKDFIQEVFKAIDDPKDVLVSFELNVTPVGNQVVLSANPNTSKLSFTVGLNE